MEANRILSTSLLDLVFDNRNKDYGAYHLRTTYHTRIKKALIITGSVTGLLLTSVLLMSSLKPHRGGNVSISTVDLQKVDIEEKPPVIPPKTQPKPIEQVRTVQLSTPRLVENVEEPPPTQEEATHARIDVKPHDGIDDSGPLEIKDIDSKGIIEAKKDDGPPKPFEKVEIEAKYDGDWTRFLLRNLRSDVPVDNGAPVGKYKVAIRFVVDVNGSVSDITAVSANGYGMEEEAMRVLKKAEKWKPAIQNGIHVPAYHTQVIVFDVQGNE